MTEHKSKCCGQPVLMFRSFGESSEIPPRPFCGGVAGCGSFCEVISTPSPEKEPLSKCCEVCHADMGEAGGFNSACIKCPCHNNKEDFIQDCGGGGANQGEVKIAYSNEVTQHPEKEPCEWEDSAKIKCAINNYLHNVYGLDDGDKLTAEEVSDLCDDIVIHFLKKALTSTREEATALARREEKKRIFKIINGYIERNNSPIIRKLCWGLIEAINK